ncbi:OmpA family protein [Pseudomonas sp. RGM2987]|uniref:OmpA family protein n=1 Tax=Pseudomonas sp. RGM2987 TaxID=2930090 RepID=UPI001FD63F00|nr:OmpA family protein [Pseudomonas sp. RGM2987]MCJ8207144.1 type VI secretion system ImpA family N-terminal domain-containing protein [Pseudomonas sp. RGM2987]
MTVWLEMHIRVGGDPRHHEEFSALWDELAKLGHPACPDVDWNKVEQLCLILLRQNGAELQTVSFYTLARSQRTGLQGMAQGLGLLDTLSAEWPQLWPPTDSMRLDILEWLFAQLQRLLRSFSLAAHAVSTLIELDRLLASLDERLVNQTCAPLPTLVSLRRQVVSLITALQRSRAIHERPLHPVSSAAAGFVMPVLLSPPPRARSGERSIALWACAGGIMLALVIGLAWRVGLTGSADEPVLPEPVRLDSLSLFDTGSAALKPGSTGVLVNALMDIKAQPGWLIVIAGHTDATGPDAHNLQLSQARASAVRDWMQRMGNIPADCFAVQGFGASQPIADNLIEAGRMANRRVDIRLVPQVGACEPSTTGVAEASSL